MGQESSFAIPVVKNNNPINFNPQSHEFESEYVQRIKQTPFVSAVLYSSQPFMYIEPAETTMEMLLAPRLNTTKLFPKEEILKVIEHVFAGLNQLKNKNFESYGNISLSSIFYHKQSKSFKLINPAFFNSTNYLMAREGLKFSFLAPEQLLNLSNEGEPLQKSFKTDVFIFGICLLQICTLTDSREIYCPQTYNIFDVEIQQRLKKIQELYSPPIANFIELCLAYEIEKRMDVQNGLKEIRFLKEQEKAEPPKLQPVQQPNVTQVLSPRGQPKKGTLSFGPGHLPKKLQQPQRQQAY